MRAESAPDILSAISGELLNFYGNNPLIDDFTLLVLKRDPQP
jgi:hypothetical protein